MTAFVMVYTDQGHYKAQVLGDGETHPTVFKPGGIYFVALNEAMLLDALGRAYPEGFVPVTARRMNEVVKSRQGGS